MSKINILPMEEITVARVKSRNGASGGKETFDILESRMNGLRGRKMYGVFYLQNNEYFACVKLDEQFPDDMGFEKSIIPGGKYARKKVENWSSKIHKIALIFRQLEKECVADGYEIDPDRPRLEYYKSFKELICMLPVK